MKRELKISEQTMSFIDLKIEFNKFHGKVADAINAMYSDGIADNIIEDFYTAAALPVTEFLDKYLVVAISEDLDSDDCTEI